MGEVASTREVRRTKCELRRQKSNGKTGREMRGTMRGRMRGQLPGQMPGRAMGPVRGTRSGPLRGPLAVQLTAPTAGWFCGTTGALSEVRREMGWTAPLTCHCEAAEGHRGSSRGEPGLGLPRSLRQACLDGTGFAVRNDDSSRAGLHVSIRMKRPNPGKNLREMRACACKSLKTASPVV